MLSLEPPLWEFSDTLPLGTNVNGMRFKCVPHAQHDCFSYFNLSCHWFEVLSFLKLSISADHDRLSPKIMVEVKINNVQLLKVIWNRNVNKTKYKQWHRQWFHSFFVMVTPLRKRRFPKDKELVVTKRQHNYSFHRFPTAKFGIWSGNLNQTPENCRYLMLRKGNCQESAIFV